jgi:hypothetical protein
LSDFPSDYPYERVLPFQVWRQSIAQNLPVWPGVGQSSESLIGPSTKIVSAGSCFAAALSGYLQQAGFNYLLTEPPPPWLSQAQAQAFHYGIYSARYGHIYTSLQFLQLIQRAWGHFQPTDDCWRLNENDAWVDSFRPGIQPGGFSSPAEMRSDRELHFAAVREALSQAEVMIFTLGLTECWLSRLDGAVYPVCPGRRFGRFEAEQYHFHNLSPTEVETQMSQAIECLQQFNPGLKWILTLSPVPLAVTYTSQHILSATAYSKAVLRTAIENLCQRFDQVRYFPAYEWVMHDRAGAFGEDGRSVKSECVAEIMQRFAQGFVSQAPTKSVLGQTVLEVQPCDEEALLALLDRDFL